MKRRTRRMIGLVLSAGMALGCGAVPAMAESTEASGDYDLTLYSIQTTDPEFKDWLSNV